MFVGYPKPMYSYVGHSVLFIPIHALDVKYKSTIFQDKESVRLPATINVLGLVSNGPFIIFQFLFSGPWDRIIRDSKGWVLRTVLYGLYS